MPIPRKIAEQMIKQNVCEHLENNGAISRCQHGFVKNTLWQRNCIFLFDAMTSPRQGMPWTKWTYLLAKHFTVSHDILVVKILKCELDGATVRWIQS